MQRVEPALAEPIEDIVRAARLGSQELRAHRRRGGERHHHRNAHGYGERYRELPKQPPDNAAHQQNRNEDRDERGTHGDHGEAHFARSAQRSLNGVDARFEITRDVLDHDDGVIHDEAGGDGQRHQRQVVHAVAEKVHHAEGAQKRDRHGDARDNRCPHVAQESEYHEDDQNHGDHQRDLDVPDGGANGRSAVQDYGELDGGGDRSLEERHDPAHAVHGLDDVGGRLAEKNDEDGKLAVREARVAAVLDRVRHLRHVPEPHRGSVDVADDERPVGGGSQQLVGGMELPGG